MPDPPPWLPLAHRPIVLPCDRCGHPWDDHELSLDFDPRDGFPIDQAGGRIRCPVDGCDCTGTWGVGPSRPPAIDSGLTDGA